jgi:hypothetical protein
MHLSDQLFTDGETRSFHCAIHGTVLVCPHRFMSCTEPLTASDSSDATNTACTVCWFRHTPRCTTKGQNDGPTTAKTETDVV